MDLMAGPIEWQNLKCDCGCEQFVPKVVLRWKPSGGVTDQAAGYQCRDCRADVDTASLVRIAELARKRQELRSLEQELADQGMAVRPAAGIGKATGG
jgi:hypothetical protein